MAGARARGERGTSAIEFSIIAPIFLLLIFTIIQGGLYFYARNTAQSAAREGVSYLRLAGNNSDPGAFIAGAEHVTEGYASKLGRLNEVVAVGTINKDSGRVSMLVSGVVVLPLGGSVRIQQTSSATLEQFRGDVNRPVPGGPPTGTGEDGGGNGGGGNGGGGADGAGGGGGGAGGGGGG